MPTHDEQQQKRADPRHIGLHNCYVCDTGGRVHERETGYLVGRIVLTNFNMGGLAGYKVDRDGGIRNDDGQLVAIAAPFLVDAVRGNHTGSPTEPTHEISHALRTELRKHGPALSPSFWKMKRSEKMKALASVLSAKQTCDSFRSLRGLRVAEKGRVRDSEGITVGRVIATARGSIDDLVGCSVDVKGRVLRDGAWVALATPFISAHSERTAEVNEELKAEFLKVCAQRSTVKDTIKRMLLLGLNQMKEDQKIDHKLHKHDEGMLEGFVPSPPLPVTKASNAGVGSQVTSQSQPQSSELVAGFSQRRSRLCYGVSKDRKTVFPPLESSLRRRLEHSLLGP